MNQVVMKRTERGEIRELIRAAAADRFEVMDIDPPIRATALALFIDVRAASLIPEKYCVLHFGRERNSSSASDRAHLIWQ